MLLTRISLFSLLPVVIVSAGASLSLAAPRHAAPASDLRQQILAADAVLANDYTIEFEMRRPALRFDAEQGEQVLNVRATRKGDTLALRATVTYEQPPQHRPVTTHGYQEIDFDSQGNLWLWRMTDINVLASPEINDSVANYQLLTVAPNDQVIKVESNRQRHRYTLGSPENTYLLDQFLLAAGRDFGRHLERLLTSETGEGTTISAQMTGSYGVALSGMWTLTTDAAERNMVRAAGFETPNGAPVLTITTHGAVAAEDDQRLAFAESGTLEYAYGGHPSYRIRVRTLSAKAQPDDNLITQVHAVVTAPPPAGGETIDYRSPQPTRTFESSSEDCQ